MAYNTSVPSAAQAETLAMLANGDELINWGALFWTVEPGKYWPCPRCGGVGIPAWITETGTVNALLRRGWIVQVGERTDDHRRREVYGITEQGVRALALRPTTPEIPNQRAMSLFHRAHHSHKATLPSP